MKDYGKEFADKKWSYKFANPKLKPKTLMKNIIILLGCAVILIVACSGYNPSNPNNITYTTADVYNWNKHNGKTIKSIRYIKNAKTLPGCDDLVIYFSDGTRVRCHVSKYILDVSE